jgi:uncharacterized protein YydD (DUF2326 family)
MNYTHVGKPNATDTLNDKDDAMSYEELTKKIDELEERIAKLENAQPSKYNEYHFFDGTWTCSH